MIDKVLYQIYKTLSRKVKYNNGNVSLFEGQTGQIIYLSYYSHCKQDNDITNEVQNILDEYLSNFINSDDINPTYSAGIIGVLAGVKHLNDKNFIKVNYEELQYELKQYILKSLDFMLKNNKLDFLYGAVGIGIFSIHNDFCVEEINNKIISYLASNKITYENSYSWNMLIRKGNEYGENIGLAHGISSIIIYLCKLYQKKKDDTLIKELISKACNFIMSNKNTNSNVISVFPTINQKLSADNLQSRMAWCYGDLGIALALWNAGKILNNDELMRFSLSVFDNCTERKELNITMIHDACFCHGSSGVAQIFRRMYYETGEKKYLQAADYWIKETLKLYTNAPSCFLFYANGIYKNMYDLLSGISGVGLALLSNDNNISTSDWDKLFLLS